MAVNMKAPVAGKQFYMPDATRYTADDAAVISDVADEHVLFLLSAGCVYADSPFGE